MDFLKITNEAQPDFKKMAEILFNEFVVETHDAKYRLSEIEFYWNSEQHKDKCTYERKHVNPNNGEWFFHYSGVDIALKNDLGGYGGILIRGIYDITNGNVYNGPLVCCMKLFSGTNAFTDTIKTKIVKHDFTQAEVREGIRIGLGDNAVKGGTDKLNYRFFINAK